MESETDAAVLLEWLNSNETGPERVLQSTAADQLCMAILMTENVDRCIQKYTPRLFIPALVHLFLDASAPDSLLEIASRAITYFLDLSNDCIQRLLQVQHGLEALSSKLIPRDINDRISKELAEQIVKIFEKVSHVRVPTEATENLFVLLAQFGPGLHLDTLTSALIVFKSLCADRASCSKLARYDLTALTQSPSQLITQKVIECLPVLIEHGAPIPRPVPEALSSHPDILSRIVHDRLDVDPHILFGLEGSNLDHRLADSILGVVFEKEHDPPPKRANPQWSDMHELLAQAIMNGNCDLERFQTNAADIYNNVNALNEHRDCLLGWAAAFGTEYHIKYLLTLGANPRLGRKGSALHYAAYTNNKPVYSALLKFGASADSVDAKGMTPLEAATSLRSKSTLNLYQESVISFEPRKPSSSIQEEPLANIIQRLLETQSTNARGLRIYRRLFANLATETLIAIIDGPSGRRILSDLVNHLKNQLEDPESFYTSLRLIEDLLIRSQDHFLSRLHRIGLVTRIEQLFAALKPDPPALKSFPAVLNSSIATVSMSPITSGPYVFGNWHFVECNAHVIVWHKNMQIAMDIWKVVVSGPDRPSSSFQFRVRADGKVNGIDGWSSNSRRISLSSCVDFVQRIEFIRDQAAVSKPHSIETLFRGVNNHVRSLDSGLCIHHFPPATDSATGTETPEQIYVYLPTRQARSFNELASLIKLEQNTNSAHTPIGLVASWNRAEEKSNLLSIGLPTNNSLNPAFSAILSASDATIRRIYSTYIQGVTIPPSPAAAELEHCLRDIRNPVGFARLIEILKSRALSTYELSISSLLQYLDRIAGFSGLFHSSDVEILVRAIVSILDNDDRTSQYLPLYSIASPCSIGSYLTTTTNGHFAVMRRRRKAIDIKSLAVRVRMTLRHNDHFQRPYQITVSPFVCVEQLENALYDRFVRQWYLLRRQDLNFHKKIVRDRPLVFTHRTIDIIRFIGKNGNRTSDFVDPSKGHIMRLCCVHNGDMSYGKEIQNGATVCEINLNEPAKLLASYFQIDLTISLTISGFKIGQPQNDTNSINGFLLYASHMANQGYVQILYRKSCPGPGSEIYLGLLSGR